MKVNKTALLITEVSMDAGDEVAQLRCDYGLVDLVDWQPVQRLTVDFSE
jgi:hypothetical protein